MDAVIGAVLGGFGSIVVFVIGATIARAQKQSTLIYAPDNDSTSCEALCRQLQTRRSERCTAEADARAAQARLDNLSMQLRNVMIAVAALLAAAYVVSVIPFVGPVLAAAMFAAAATLLQVVAFGLLGAWSAAETDRQSKTQAASDARRREDNARFELFSDCADTRDRCLQSLPSCP